jgi:uncharacterized protein YdaU (DUF1376 family)
MDAGSFIADTIGLSNNDVGIYVKLTMLYWASGNQLPSDESILKRKITIKSDEDASALELILDEFFPIDEDGIRVNQGLDQQLQQIKETSKKQSNNGKLAHMKKAPFAHQRIEEDDNPDDF